jgi:hypothetical protein
VRLYKLTDENDKTHDGCQWGEGITHTAPGTGDLCGPGYIHAHTNPLLAVLLNPVHEQFNSDTMHFWECDGDVGKTDFDFKVGCTRLTTIKRIPIPVVTLEQWVRFGILSVLTVYHEPSYARWATGWLDGSDRSAATAMAVAHEAVQAVEEAWVAALEGAVNPKEVAATAGAVRAADAAAQAAAEAAQAEATAVSSEAAWRAARTAHMAARAAETAAVVADIDLIALARQAMGIEAVDYYHH